MLARPSASGPSRGAGILGSFRHALRGVAEVAARERNMKIHLCAGTAIGLAGSEVGFGEPARLALLLCVALVLAAETLNSALEALVDLHTQNFRHEARQVKDAAAGVVLVLAAGAALVGAAVLAGSWAAIVEAAERVGARAAWHACVLASVAVLLFARLARGMAGAVAAAGAAGVVAVATRSASLAFTALAAGTLGIAVGARFVALRPASREGKQGPRGGGGRAPAVRPEDARGPAPLPSPLPAARGEGAGPNRNEHGSDPLPSGERRGRGG